MNADQAKGYQQLTSVSGATALTVPAGTGWALIQAETKSVRWRDDGTNPSATVGMLIAAGDTLTYTGNKLPALKVIETSSAATVNISYYG